MKSTRGYDELPLVWLLAGADGRIRDLNASGERLFGRHRKELIGADLSSFADPVTRASLPGLLATACIDGQSVTRLLTFQRSDGSVAPVLAAIQNAQRLKAEDRIQILGIEDSFRTAHLRELESRAEMLAGFIDASSEAVWCIKYTEPVDLRHGVQEVVRQVFENKCHWQMCNAAMAKLYNLPDGLDFNRQPVAAYFRRTPENEAFVRQLIDAHFCIDAAPSLECGHDGKVFYVENSVRCHIEEGLLSRMWGTVRDITEFRTTQNVLTERKREVTEILTALPDAILVVDIARRAIALNPAFESTFGWTADEVLGNDVSFLIDLETARPGLGRWFAPTPSRWTTNVITARGRPCRCDVTIAPLPTDSDRRFVMSIRTERPNPEEARGRVKSNYKRQNPKKRVSGKPRTMQGSK